MSQSRSLCLEELEARDVPAVFGFPWTDARHLTVSFVPDGTLLGDAAGAARSDLFAKFDASLPRADWQRDMLRALQTWTAEAGIELSVVADSGDPLGTAGAAQGDPRFGDIRIAGTALSSGSVSSSVPFSPFAGTWAGDLFFNTAAPWGGSGYDLYSVALHEAGHVLGVAGQTTDPSDPMFEYYTGPKAGLSAADIAAVQALYGQRQADRFEGRSTSFQVAARETFLAALSSEDEDAALDPDFPHAIDAGLTVGDADSYSYTASGSFSVRLGTAGRSLLTARLTVLDAQGRTVATVQATDPTAGDLSLSIKARAGERFTLRVEGAGASAFSIGSYRLVAKPLGNGPDPLAVLAQKAFALLHRNDSLGSATALNAEDGTWVYRGRISRSGDVDYYRLAGFGGGALDVQAWGATVELLDSRGRVLARSEGGSLRVENLRAGSGYHLKVSGAPGAYVLGAQAGAPAQEPDLDQSGTLTASSQQQFRGLLLPQSSVVRFQVDLGGTGAAATVALYDLQGNIVWQQTILAGGQADVRLFLAEGEYTLRLVGGKADGSILAALTYRVRTTVMSDPIGPTLPNPNGPVPPRSVRAEWYTSGFRIVLSPSDPYGRPVSFIEPPPVVYLPPEKKPRPWGR